MHLEHVLWSAHKNVAPAAQGTNPEASRLVNAEGVCRRSCVVIRGSIGIYTYFQHLPLKFFGSSNGLPLNASPIRRHRMGQALTLPSTKLYTKCSWIRSHDPNCKRNIMSASIAVTGLHSIRSAIHVHLFATHQVNSSPRRRSLNYIISSSNSLPHYHKVVRQTTLLQQLRISKDSITLPSGLKLQQNKHKRQWMCIRSQVPDSEKTGLSFRGHRLMPIQQGNGWNRLHLIRSVLQREIRP